MRGIRLLWKVVCLIITSILCISTYVSSMLGEFEINNDSYLLDEVSNSFLIVNSPNTGITNINGVSNIINQMIDDGWEVYKENVNNESIDVVLVKSVEKVGRVYYECKSNEITVFMNDYEKSGDLFTYACVKEKK